jgi:hypothetical protein
MGDGLDIIVMGSICDGPPSPLWAMTGDSAEEFHMSSDREGRIYLLSPRRHDTRASPASAIIISQLESTPTARAPVTIPSWQVTLQSDTNLPLE